MRASNHVAMRRPAEARALVAEAQALQPGVGDEVVGLLADFEYRRDDARVALERASDQPYTSWYTPYRLATLQPWQGATSLARMKTLLAQATALNPNADDAWSYLGEVLAALDDADGARPRRPARWNSCRRRATIGWRPPAPTAGCASRRRPCRRPVWPAPWPRRRRRSPRPRTCWRNLRAR